MPTDVTSLPLDYLVTVTWHNFHQLIFRSPTHSQTTCIIIAKGKITVYERARKNPLTSWGKYTINMLVLQ